MPKQGMVWWLITISTLNHWLPGDPRGFRSPHHRIHSSGDYRNRPPEKEHAGLHEHAQSISGQPVDLPPEVRPLIGQTFVCKLKELGYRAIAICVDHWHVHFLAELPIDIKQAKTIVGQCKGLASHKVKDRLPGRIWAGGGSFELIKTQAHHRRAFEYIVRHREQGAWVWTYRDTE